MKQCIKCKLDKEDAEFYRQNDRQTGMGYCIPCHNARTLERQQARKLQAVEFLGGKCWNCGYNKYIGAFDFHHLDPNQKDQSWHSMRGWSWERLRIELARCALLCVRCHREVEAGFSQVGKHILPS